MKRPSMFSKRAQQWQPHSVEAALLTPPRRKTITADDLLHQYQAGDRCFIHINLVDELLPWATLPEIDLRYSTLCLCIFEGADLSHANLSYADLRRVDLTAANLQGANLQGANLRDADLRGAQLTGANLTGATLTNANLNGVIWGDADLAQPTDQR